MQIRDAIDRRSIDGRIIQWGVPLTRSDCGATMDKDIAQIEKAFSSPDVNYRSLILWEMNASGSQIYIHGHVHVCICMHDICMYVCMYECMYLCMHVVLHVYVCSTLYVCMYVCMYE